MSNASTDPAPAFSCGFLIDRWSPERGGAERELAELARALEQRGRRVLAFARAASPGAPGEFRRVRAGGFTRSARERALARALPDAAAAAGCDVTVGVRHLERVDLYWPHGGSVRASFEARELARGREPGPPRGRFATFLELERRLLDGGGARAIACVSTLVQDELVREYPGARERLVLAENGVDLERFAPAHRAAAQRALRASLALEDGEPLVVFVARDPLLKGLETLLAALAQLRERRWHLLVAGPRRAARWRARARALGLAAGRVTVRAEVEPELLAHGADVHAAPTWRDTSGLAVLEALAAGTPAITTRRAGAAAAIGGAEAGTVLERAGDATALAAALADRLERVERGADPRAVRAAARLRPRGEWLEQMEALVSRLVDRPRAPAAPNSADPVASRPPATGPG